MLASSGNTTNEEKLEKFEANMERWLSSTDDPFVMLGG
jgi:hypothetical protein